MACRYCYASREKDYQTLDLDFAKKAIEEYIGKDSRYGLNQIRFFAGGEPTTEFELLKTILQLSRERCPDLFAELQTNGFFSLERAEWLGNNMDVIWISLDLFPEANDVYRVTKTGKPSSPIIERNLKYFRDNPKKALVGVRGTITNDNLYRQKEGIDYLYSMGIRDIWVDPIFIVACTAFRRPPHSVLPAPCPPGRSRPRQSAGSRRCAPGPGRRPGRRCRPRPRP